MMQKEVVTKTKWLSIQSNKIIKNENRITFCWNGFDYFLWLEYTTKKRNQKAQWLIGTWENNTSKGSIYETWIKINDIEFSGKSYTVKGKDTTVFETIRIVQEQEGLFYIPSVKKAK